MSLLDKILGPFLSHSTAAAAQPALFAATSPKVAPSGYYGPKNVSYANSLIGFQVTGGSSSVRAMWDPLRRAGAVARVMLISAAAQGWNVDPTSCRAEKGEVIHGPTGRKLRYGALADTAAARRIKLVGSIGVAGHLSIDSDGRLYVMDMEQNAVFRRAPDGRVETIVADPRLMWPDTLAIGPDEYLYVTSSQHDRRPQFHDGEDLRERPFAVYRVFVGAGPVRPGRSDG